VQGADVRFFLCVCKRRCAGLFMCVQGADVRGGIMCIVFVLFVFSEVGNQLFPVFSPDVHVDILELPCFADYFVGFFAAEETVYETLYSLVL